MRNGVHRNALRADVVMEDVGEQLLEILLVEPCSRVDLMGIPPAQDHLEYAYAGPATAEEERSRILEHGPFHIHGERPEPPAEIPPLLLSEVDIECEAGGILAEIHETYRFPRNRE